MPPSSTKPIDSRFHKQAGTIEDPKCFADDAYVRSRDPRPAQADDVDARDVLPIRHCNEWNDVLATALVARQQGKPAHANELMKRGISGEKDAIVNLAVPAKKRIVRQDAMVADPGIVSDVRGGHQVIVVAYTRDAMPLDMRAAMDRDAAEDIEITNFVCGYWPR